MKRRHPRKSGTCRRRAHPGREGSQAQISRVQYWRNSGAGTATGSGWTAGEREATSRGEVGRNRPVRRTGTQSGKGWGVGGAGVEGTDGRERESGAAQQAAAQQRGAGTEAAPVTARAAGRQQPGNSAGAGFQATPAKAWKSHTHPASSGASQRRRVKFMGWKGRDRGASGSGTAGPLPGVTPVRPRGRTDRAYLAASLPRNLAGSFSKSGLQLLQQSLISCP
jgi:hypothetical protein